MKHVILCAVVFFPAKMLLAQQGPQPAMAQPDPNAAAAQQSAAPDPNAATAMQPAPPDPNTAAVGQPAALPPPPAQDVVPSQLTWPDTVDLAENAPEILQTDDPKIIELFKKTGALFDAMAAIIDPLVKNRADLYQKYFELDAKLDEFFENIGLDEGALEGLSPVDPNAAAPQAPTNMVTFKKEFDQIDAQRGAIMTTKESIKKALSLIDSEIDKSKTLALQSRKKALDILKQTNEHDAQGIYDGINKDLESITATQKNLETGAIHDFQTAYDKIQADIQALQTLVGQLRAKATVPEEPAATASAHPAVPISLASRRTPIAIPAQQTTFPNYLLTRMTELFTGAMKVASTTYTTLKDALNKSIATKNAQAPTPPPQTVPVTASQATSPSH